MKLQTLLEVSFTGTSGGLISDYDPAEVADVIKDVMDSPEYAELVKITPMVSSPAELRHGKLSFKVEDFPNYDKESGRYYYIDVHGNIRYQTKKWSEKAKKYLGDFGKLQTIQPDDDLYTRYLNAIDVLMDKLKKREFRSAHPTSLEIIGTEENEIRDISDIEGLEYLRNKLELNHCSLTNLVGLPRRLGTLIVIRNQKVLSLEGCPNIITRTLNFNTAQLVDIPFLPQKVGERAIFSFGKISSLSGIGRKFIKECPEINFRWAADVESNIIGLLNVKNLKRLEVDSHAPKDFKKAIEIVKKYLRTRDIIECQEEMLDHKLEQYAKL